MALAARAARVRDGPVLAPAPQHRGAERGRATVVGGAPRGEHHIAALGLHPLPQPLHAHPPRGSLVPRHVEHEHHVARRRVPPHGREFPPTPAHDQVPAGLRVPAHLREMLPEKLHPARSLVALRAHALAARERRELRQGHPAREELGGVPARARAAQHQLLRVPAPRALPRRPRVVAQRVQHHREGAEGLHLGIGLRDAMLGQPEVALRLPRTQRFEEDLLPLLRRQLRLRRLPLLHPLLHHLHELRPFRLPRLLRRPVPGPHVVLPKNGEDDRHVGRRRRARHGQGAHARPPGGPALQERLLHVAAVGEAPDPPGRGLPVRAARREGGRRQPAATPRAVQPASRRDRGSRRGLGPPPRRRVQPPAHRLRRAGRGRGQEEVLHVGQRARGHAPRGALDALLPVGKEPARGPQHPRHGRGRPVSKQRHPPGGRPGPQRVLRPSCSS
mmetsp:Transcript_43201/g.105715  ORF Transcript_43201/g.105715 Transcript_43201/m.105715 type:complete len:446 (-) Transcript_43201:25-1362(-)